MKPIRQEDGLGCAVACVAFILHIPYSDTLELFHDGKRKAQDTGFYCPEIVKVLNSKGLNYSWQKIKKEQSEDKFKNYTIVFIERSKQHPYGHFLCRYKNRWMDPWKNLLEYPVKAGFRQALPGKPTYQVYSVI